MLSNLFSYKELSSTNSELSRLMQNQLPEFTIVQADYQSEGRGQLGAKWESECGKNLLLSFLFYPDFLPVKDFFLLSQFTSLALLDFLIQLYPSEYFSIKWPNDIYFKDKKIAGILIENSLQGSVIKSTIVGIGLNVNQTQFLSDAPNPISLSTISGHQYSLSTLLDDLAEHLQFRYHQLRLGKFQFIRDEYRTHLYQKGKLSSYEDNTGRFEATLESVANDGVLCLRLSSGELRTYYFKEVKFIPIHHR